MHISLLFINISPRCILLTNELSRKLLFTKCHHEFIYNSIQRMTQLNTISKLSTLLFASNREISSTENRREFGWFTIRWRGFIRSRLVICINTHPLVRRFFHAHRIYRNIVRVRKYCYTFLLLRTAFWYYHCMLDE